ncbi:hypothetical protein WJD08_16210 [Salmonella enterica subsp. enterica serovar Corvallis]|nr:hypothetical protein [Salmonella enterica]EBU6869061.1 hypothetical protein [Salmonella enterica subsp. enterica serovar Molade]KTI35609.1 hypothetical protein ASV07_11125 [Enterobacter roggenkampii]EAV4978458.1 hypothetical protein [Salmonella enterica]EBJ7932128.1 hypothetical protein [Salmonella enterica]
MKIPLAVMCSALCIPAYAIQCGAFSVQPGRNMTTINGDSMRVVSVKFSGAYHDYSQATLTLLPDNITTADRQYRMTTEGGNAVLELMTRELPPRVLNREQCDSGLSGFEWYTGG